MKKKKEYLTPDTVVVKVLTENSLLEDSSPGYPVFGHDTGEPEVTMSEEEEEENN